MKVWLFKFVDATLGAALCWLVGRSRHLMRCEPPVPPDPAVVGIHRVLVIRPGGLGDMVQLLPTLRALRERFPAVVVEVICERRNAAVLRLSGLADRIACYDAHPFAVLMGLWRTRYDVVLDTEQFHHMSALMALTGGAPVRIGFKINPGRNPLYTHLITYDLDGWEAEQFMRLLAPLGIVNVEPVVEGILRRGPQPLPPPPSYLPPPASLPPILIHPGSTTRYKLWPLDRWVALVERLQAATGRPIVLVGGRSDAALAERILACDKERVQPQPPTTDHQPPPNHLPPNTFPPTSLWQWLLHPTSTWRRQSAALQRNTLDGLDDVFWRAALRRRRAHAGARVSWLSCPEAYARMEAPPPASLSSLAGRTTLEETAAALGAAALFVGGDSGLAHLAVAMGTPTVVLFGPSDSRKWGARGPAHAVVRHELACAPCAIFGYHKLCRSIACMDGITVEAVAAACIERLG